MRVGKRMLEPRTAAFRVYLRNFMPEDVEQVARVLSTCTLGLYFAVGEDLENVRR